MAAVMGRTEIEIKKVENTEANVPSDPLARLMYYFNCVCSCVEPDDDYTIRRLRDYQYYFYLTKEEEAQLIVLCLALSPDDLVGKIFNEVESSKRGNLFYEMSAVKTDVIITESILIGGQRKRVQSMMAFTTEWKNYCYTEPLEILNKPPPPEPTYYIPDSPPRESSSCTIV